MTAKILCIISSILNIALIGALIALCIYNPNAARPLAEVKTRDVSSDYQLVHDLFAYTEDYLDKDVELTGYYSNSLSEKGTTEESTKESEALYHFLTVFDSAKDCYYTIEFVPNSYTDLAVADYIYVKGIFSKYSEGDTNYVTLKDATYRIIEKAEQDSKETFSAE